MKAKLFWLRIITLCFLVTFAFPCCNMDNPSETIASKATETTYDKIEFDNDSNMICTQFKPSEYLISLYKKKKKEDSLRKVSKLRSSGIGLEMFDPIKSDQIRSIKTNFLYLNENKETFLIRTAYTPYRYLTYNGHSKLMDFRENQQKK